MTEEVLENKVQGKNWVATMALCWLFGAFGAHRFYTGKNNSAWVMAVLTITGIFSIISFIWTLVDGFSIALGKFTHADGSELYERINWFGYTYIVVMILSIIGAFFYISVIAAIVAAIIGNGANLPALP